MVKKQQRHWWDSLWVGYFAAMVVVTISQMVSPRTERADWPEVAAVGAILAFVLVVSYFAAKLSTKGEGRNP